MWTSAWHSRFVHQVTHVTPCSRTRRCSVCGQKIRPGSRGASAQNHTRSRRLEQRALGDGLRQAGRPAGRREGGGRCSSFCQKLGDSVSHLVPVTGGAVPSCWERYRHALLRTGLGGVQPSLPEHSRMLAPPQGSGSWWRVLMGPGPLVLALFSALQNDGLSTSVQGRGGRRDGR